MMTLVIVRSGPWNVRSRLEPLPTDGRGATTARLNWSVLVALRSIW